MPIAAEYGSFNLEESSGLVQGLFYLCGAEHRRDRLREFQILTAVLMKIAVLCHITPCDSLLKMTSELKSYTATNEKWGGYTNTWHRGGITEKHSGMLDKQT